MRTDSPLPSPAFSPHHSSYSVASEPAKNHGLYVPYKIIERCIPYVREQRLPDDSSKTDTSAIALMEEGTNPQKLARWFESAEWPTRQQFIKSLEGDEFARSAFARKPEEQAAIQRYKRSIGDLKATCIRVFPAPDTVTTPQLKHRPLFRRVLMVIRKLCRFV